MSKMFGERLRKARKEKKVNAKFIANELKISLPTYYHSYEEEANQSKEEIVRKICNILNVDANYLFGINNNPNMSLEILKEERKRKKITQEQMSRLIGITKGIYCYFERNIYKSLAEKIKKICDILEIDANYLYGTNICRDDYKQYGTNICKDDYKQYLIKELQKCYHITESIDEPKIKSQLHKMIIVNKQDDITIFYKMVQMKINKTNDEGFVLLCCVVYSYVSDMVETIARFPEYITKLDCWFGLYSNIIENLTKL